MRRQNKFEKSSLTNESTNNEHVCCCQQWLFYMPTLYASLTMRNLILLNILLMSVLAEIVNGAPFVTEFTAANSIQFPLKSVSRINARRISLNKFCDDLCQLRGGESVVDSTDAGLVIKDSTESEAKTEKFVYTLNQLGDGHEDEPFVPRRFIRMQKGNLDKAIAAYNATALWRAAHGVDSILSKPHPGYDVFKKVLPHFFCGPDCTGHVVFCQCFGQMKVDLLEANNLTRQDLLMHYVYSLEYCWNLLEKRPDQTMTSILDGKDLSLRTVQKLFAFINEFVSMMSHHYPQRSYKTLIINAPAWAGTMYKLVSPLLRESTRSKISILNRGKEQDAVLKEILGDAIPSELSDIGTQKGCESTYEQQMRAFVMARLEEAGVEMQAVKQL